MKDCKKCNTLISKWVLAVRGIIYHYCRNCGKIHFIEHGGLNES